MIRMIHVRQSPRNAVVAYVGGPRKDLAAMADGMKAVLVRRYFSTTSIMRRLSLS